MPNSDEFMDHLLDLLSEAGPIAPRRMFGGHGLFIDGVMIGLVASDTLYLKVDEVNRPAYDERGLRPFSYVDPNGKSWSVRPGTIVNGASIPAAFWSIIGGPFSVNVTPVAVR